ncbi:hypothetical protein DFQ27_004050 [Actinomortierella ambigua]|uniref:BZIP domain-containing protein n=1 Tax=Actinomortierella ambigua TaxID=1343610 RepID=A0A9P6U4X9_9FUNG|nr:hypothetical protein DFQ27_004050 [Actinomortierella ambigua]
MNTAVAPSIAESTLGVPPAEKRSHPSLSFTSSDKDNESDHFPVLKVTSAQISKADSQSGEEPPLKKERKKPGRKPNPASPAIRKEQNRAAQRAFRDRKERHLQQLENMIKDLKEANHQTTIRFQREAHQLKNIIEALQSENYYLREVVFSFESALNKGGNTAILQDVKAELYRRHYEHYAAKKLQQQQQQPPQQQQQHQQQQQQQRQSQQPSTYDDSEQQVRQPPQQQESQQQQANVTTVHQAQLQAQMHAELQARVQAQLQAQVQAQVQAQAQVHAHKLSQAFMTPSTSAASTAKPSSANPSSSPAPSNASMASSSASSSSWNAPMNDPQDDNIFSMNSEILYKAPPLFISEDGNAKSPLPLEPLSMPRPGYLPPGHVLPKHTDYLKHPTLFDELQSSLFPPGTLQSLVHNGMSSPQEVVNDVSLFEQLDSQHAAQDASFSPAQNMFTFSMDSNVTSQGATFLDTEGDGDSNEFRMATPTLGFDDGPKQRIIPSHRLQMEIRILASAPPATDPNIDAKVYELPHDPRIDLIPCPKLRAQMILHQNKYDIEELCHLLISEAICHGHPLDPHSWQLPEAFFDRFGFLMGAELMRHRNKVWPKKEDSPCRDANRII